MKLLTTFTILMICINAIGQNLSAKMNSFIDTVEIYTDSTGKKLRIQNSLPKGGGDIDGQKGYIDSNGKKYGYAIFWTRIINETSTPVEITINFSGNLNEFTPSSALFFPSDSYVKLLLPPDTMTPEKVSSYNYGIKGLKSFLDSNFDEPTSLQRTINSNEENLFYVAVLSSAPGGTIRAGLRLTEQDLFYKFSIDDNSITIPCGQIVFKK